MIIADTERGSFLTRTAQVTGSRAMWHRTHPIGFAAVNGNKPSRRGGVSPSPKLDQTLSRRPYCWRRLYVCWELKLGLRRTGCHVGKRERRSPVRGVDSKQVFSVAVPTPPGKLRGREDGVILAQTWPHQPCKGWHAPAMLSSGCRQLKTVPTGRRSR